MKTQHLLLERYDPATPLFDLPDGEIDAGGLVSILLAEHGYDFARPVLGQNGWWSMTVQELVEELESLP